jgi:hypothetical protein
MSNEQITKSEAATRPLATPVELRKWASGKGGVHHDHVQQRQAKRAEARQRPILVAEHDEQKHEQQPENRHGSYLRNARMRPIEHENNPNQCAHEPHDEEIGSNVIGYDFRLKRNEHEQHSPCDDRAYAPFGKLGKRHSNHLHSKSEKGDKNQ